jgi:HK97 family phage major capsid protein
MVDIYDEDAVQRRADELHQSAMRDYNWHRDREASTRKARQGGQTYREGGPDSYFLDLIAQAAGRVDAARDQRLRDHEAETRVGRAYTEKRTGINATQDSGGYAIPPRWLEAQHVLAAHPGRPLADASVNRPLPPGTNSINIPVLSTGTSMSVSSAQNSALPEQSGNITDSVINAPVITLQSVTTVSRQLLDFGVRGAGIDEWLAMDSGQAYAAELSSQLYSGTGSSGLATGIVNWPNVLTVSAGGSTAGLWSGIAAAQQAVLNGIYLPANIAVVNPADWAWLSATIDLEGRPILLPHTATSDALVRVATEAIVAEFAGLSLIVDPSCPSGKVIVARTSELALYEGELNYEVNLEYGAGNLSALIVAWRYMAWAIRRPAGVCVVSFAPTTPGS